MINRRIDIQQPHSYIIISNKSNTEPVINRRIDIKQPHSYYSNPISVECCFYGFLDLTGLRGLILLPGCLMGAPGDNVSNIAFGYSGYDPVSLEPRAAQRKILVRARVYRWAVLWTIQ